jgi:hypothetical protein
MKYIEMNTPKGIYRVPLKIIAIDRTKYYAENDGFEKDSKEWNEEIDFIMNDDFEGIDWLCNNMDLKDIKPFMELVKEVENNDWFYETDNFNIVEYPGWVPYED